MAGHGGKRAGAGRPSAFQQEQKQKAAQAKVEAEEQEIRQQIVDLARAGEPWAIKLWADKYIEKAGTRQQEQVDQEVMLVANFDSPSIHAYLWKGRVVEKSLINDLLAAHFKEEAVERGSIPPGPGDAVRDGGD